MVKSWTLMRHLWQIICMLWPILWLSNLIISIKASASLFSASFIEFLRILKSKTLKIKSKLHRLPRNIKIGMPNTNKVIKSFIKIVIYKKLLNLLREQRRMKRESNWASWVQYKLKIIHFSHKQSSTIQIWTLVNFRHSFHRIKSRIYSKFKEYKTIKRR